LELEKVMGHLNYRPRKSGIYFCKNIFRAKDAIKLLVRHTISNPELYSLLITCIMEFSQLIQKILARHTEQKASRSPF
jgi:hypothetical protein